MPFTSLKAIKGRLPTKDRLQRWNITTDTNCVLCDNSTETHHHLFFKCNYSNQIATKCFQMYGGQLRDNNMNQLLDYLVSQWHAKYMEPDKDSSVFTALIWWIWKERNFRLFQSKSRSIEEVSKLIHHDAEVKLKSR